MAPAARKVKFDALRTLARAVKWVRDGLGWQTYQVEYLVVGTVLLVTRLLAGGFSLDPLAAFSEHGWLAFWTDPVLRIWLADWLALIGVSYSFAHASVADRLAEVEGERVTAGQAPTIECYDKLHGSFVKREIAWLLTFLLLQSWSALVGVFIFLAYPAWRHAWRRHYPVRTSKRLRGRGGALR
jgi:hypothetical protein